MLLLLSFQCTCLQLLKSFEPATRYPRHHVLFHSGHALRYTILYSVAYKPRSLFDFLVSHPLHRAISLFLNRMHFFPLANAWRCAGRVLDK